MTDVLSLQRFLITRLAPHAESESRFLTPFPSVTLDAAMVFDAIREMSDPHMTEEEFNSIVDSLPA